MARIKKHKVSRALEYKASKKSGWSKQKIWTVILGAIMVFSVFGIMLSAQSNVEEATEYGDYKFERVRAGNELLWQVEIDENTYTFDYHPSDVEESEFDPMLTQRLRGMKAAYVTFNPNMKRDRVAAFELSRFKLQNTLFNEYNIYAMSGVLEESESYAQQPVITCANTTQAMPVISFIEGNETKAYLEGGCIIVEANEFSILAMKDRILYALLGIIE